ncbi:hypothetical protein X801_02098, partial [Opisthorchis viverrini]
FIEVPVVSLIACVDRLQVCYLCLKPYHQAKLCRSRHACVFQLCVGKHPALLHRPSSSKTENEPEPPEIESEDVHRSISDVPKSNISLAIRGPGGEVVVNVFLDDGASTTLIHNSPLPKLGLKGTPASLIIKTITGECVTRSASVSFSRESLDSEEVMSVHRAWVVDSMPCLRSLAPRPEQSRKGPLGWTFLGPLYSNPNKNQSEAIFYHISQTEDLNLQLERMFNFEFLEAACTKRAMSLNDRVTYDRMLASLEIVDGHYKIPLS